MENILLGTITMASFTVSLFFLRFWKTTHDRFFLYFAISFFVEGCNRVLLGALHFPDEQSPLFYLLRLLSFLIILYAIMDKNRTKKIRRRSDDRPACERNLS